MKTAPQPIPYQVRLKSKREVAEKTIAWYFEKPREFSFQAGQFIDLILLDQFNIDSEEHQRTFTIASAPVEDAPFLDELQKLQQQNPNYTFVGTMTNATSLDFPWSGETGYVNSDMLTKYVSDIKRSLYYIVGPPAMVKGVKAMLDSAGIRKSDVKTEEFMGY